MQQYLTISILQVKENIMFISSSYFYYLFQTGKEVNVCGCVGLHHNNPNIRAYYHLVSLLKLWDLGKLPLAAL